MDMHAIIKVPVERFPDALRGAGHHLMRGLSAATDHTLQDCVEDVIGGFADFWLVSDGEEVVGAFMTAVVEDGEDLALDVYGLGGKDLPRWGKQLSRDMTAYARRIGAKRITFCGAKALQRIYDNVHVVGQHSPGVFKYERVIS